jgi:uncharacterized protein
MNYWCIFALFWSFVSVAEPAYQLTRSSVIELTEPDTGRVYPLYIQLPASYAKEPKRSYPVVYLLDADYSFPLVSGASRFPINSGTMQPFILVAIAYDKVSKGSESRIRDYTPTKDKTWNLSTGFAKAHQKFIKKVVFPFIENNYKTDKTNKTLVGHSLGALFGASVLFSDPTMFSSYLLSSPSVWFNRESILTVKPIQPNQPIKVYLAVGELETPEFGEGQNMVSGATQLKEKIEKIANPSLKLKFSVSTAASHTTAFPTAAIQGLDWIYGIKQDE